MAISSITTTGSTVIQSPQTQEAEGAQGTGLGTIGGSGSAPILPQFEAAQGTGAAFDTPENFDLGESLGRLQSAIEQMISSGADPMEVLNGILGEMGASKDLGALLIEFAAMGRQNALDQRMNARDQARSDLEGQAETMRTSAVTQLVVSVVSVAASAASAGVSFAGAAKAGKIAADAAETGANGTAEAATALNTKAQTVAAKSQSVSGMIGLSNTSGEATGGMITKNVEADGQELAAKSQTEQSNADLAKTVMDDFKELVRSIIQFLKDMQQSEVDRMAMTTRV
ncbi:hypothetical protein [Phaeobacter sp. HF9A]|uniref:hypothetical protein n=1 Tax=Phaeobacter sp. HF9A TaxID=2721561 RepID=UPI00142F4F67|nr:hypothetical protein [Phaeobacter sp. HF9A]NIZ12021.1 hypothetical protein [Phaeobacter sp. HF9A]